jgi:hypothetical protein
MSLLNTTESFGSIVVPLTGACMLHRRNSEPLNLSASRERLSPPPQVTRSEVIPDESSAIIGVVDVDITRTAVDDRTTSFDTRLAAIEAKLDAVMATLMSPSSYDLTAGLERPGLGPFQRIALATLPPGALLVGWAEIARYCRKAPRTLKRYRDREGFPAWRWGRHVVAARENIARWLVVREQARRERRRSAPALPPSR